MANPTRDAVLNNERIQRLRDAYILAEANGDQETMDLILRSFTQAAPKAVAVEQARANTSRPEFFAQGAVDKLAEYGEGGQMLAADLFGQPEWRKSAEARRAEATPGREIAAEASPFYGAGTYAPGMLIPGGVAGGLATRAVTAGLASAAEGALESGEVSAGGALAGAVGGILGNEVGRFAGRTLVGPRSASLEAGGMSTRRPNPSQHHEMVQQAKQMGIQLTPAQRTGNPVLAMKEAGLSRDPWFAGPFAEIQANNQRVINTMARDELGLGGDDIITDDVLDELHHTLGNEFTRLVGGNRSFPLSTNFANALNNIETKYQAGLLRGPEIKTLIAGLKKRFNNNQVTVKDYQQLSSDLATLARNTKDPALTRAYHEGRDALDQEFDAAFGQLPELTEVRTKWRNLRDVERAKALDSGNLSAPKLYNYIRNREGYVEPGRNQLYDLARVGHHFRSTIPNSGTPTGQAIQQTVDASPMARVVRAMGDPISRAYLSSGGRMSGPGMFNAYSPMAADVLGTLMPRLGRQMGSEEEY